MNGILIRQSHYALIKGIDDVLKKKIASIKDIINKLKFILNRRQKTLGIVVALMTVINALLQTLGVSIIVPLAGAMMTPESYMETKFAKKVCGLFGLIDTSHFFVFICAVAIIIYILKSVFSVFQLWISAKYSFMVQRELSTYTLKTYMMRPYNFFLNYGTSDIIRDVKTDSYGVNIILASCFNLLTELLTMSMIVIYITIMDWKMALCIVLLSFVCILIIYKYFKKTMRIAGEKSREYSAKSQKVLLEAVEGIKEVQVMRKQNYFVDEFKKIYALEQHPGMIQRMVVESPAYIIEAIFVVGMLGFVVVRMMLDPSFLNAMPVLASFLMGAIKMLPSLGHISSRLNSLQYYIPSLNSVYHNFMIFREEKNECSQAYRIADDCEFSSFNKAIILDSVDWKYEESKPYVLRGLNLTIKKGDSIGIIGQSGAGKSTLADVILGLYTPVSGCVKIDGINIQSIYYSYGNIIGYVPQNIYLIDGTIRENVAFGSALDDIDDQLVWECLKQARLDSFVLSSESGLDTIVGERGVKFSGGQRQRLAIARALYRKPQILIMDEATSALDNETEEAVMDAIEQLYGTITMVIIAHRLTTVKKCDHIYEIYEGKAIERSKEEIFV